jgi:hypothetical protein
MSCTRATLRTCSLLRQSRRVARSEIVDDIRCQQRKKMRRIMDRSECLVSKRDPCRAGAESFPILIKC